MLSFLLDKYLGVEWLGHTISIVFWNTNTMEYNVTKRNKLQLTLEQHGSEPHGST